MTVDQLFGAIAKLSGVAFVVTSMVAMGLALDKPLKDGLLIMGVAAGVPFLPTLALAAKGDIAFAVGLMVLLMVATVVVLLVALPLMLQGVTISAWSIAKSLLVLMLVPLAIALAIRAYWPELAAEYQPVIRRRRRWRCSCWPWWVWASTSTTSWAWSAPGGWSRSRS